MLERIPSVCAVHCGRHVLALFLTTCWNEWKSPADIHGARVAGDQALKNVVS